MRKYNAKRNGGFSLIELVIVVVIIAIIGAIAIPKMSRGAAGAGDSALIQDLSTVRSAIDLYTTEHGGTGPTTAAFVNQLTKYTDATGGTSATADATHIYGPYLKQIPSNPVGSSGYKGASTILTTGGAGTAAGGWYWDGTNFTANNPAGDVDAKGALYNGY